MAGARPRPGEVLVAIIRDRLDFGVLKKERWYRIPVESVERLLRKRWPPEWLAFYQTKIFGETAFSVRYYGKVVDIHRKLRSQLLPDQPADERSAKEYYQLFIEDLKELPSPIPSKRLRRLVFIPTTWTKLVTATEINDLFDESPLEDDLWSSFKQHGIEAERQHLVEVEGARYLLDFAVYCAAGKLDIETDGDSWHANPEAAKLDNRRDNSLHASGWTTLRFSSSQLKEQGAQYCVGEVAKTINKLGGVAWDSLPRYVPDKADDGSYQMDLFGYGEEQQ